MSIIILLQQVPPAMTAACPAISGVLPGAGRLSAAALRLLRAGGLALPVLVAGCGNLSGLGGTSRYACQAPAGVQCQSVSGTYHNGVHGSQRNPTVPGVAADPDRPSASCLLYTSPSPRDS